MSELIARGLVKRFGSREVLKGADLILQPGEAVALLGPSGSGKSTLLNLLGSLQRPDAGTILFGDTAVHELSGSALAGYRSRSVGFVFQEHHLLPQLPAIENVLLPTLAVSSDSDAMSRAQGLLDQLGVGKVSGQFPGTLSGGERQRVALARALMNQPLIILGDEPTGSLDRESGSALIDLLLDRAHEAGLIVLVVTHNEGQAARFDRVLRLVDGRL